jgi:hypothetical protein
MSHGLRPPTSAASGRGGLRRFRDLEAVRLVADLPEHGLKGGEVGTIVHVFETADAYLVEFTNDGDGSTKALAELEPGQITPT